MGASSNSGGQSPEYVEAELWSTEELRRKAVLLGDAATFTRTEQIAVRCAECLLAAEFPEGQSPCFSMDAVVKCRQIHYQSVLTAVRKLSDADIIDQVSETTLPRSQSGLRRYYTPRPSTGEPYLKPLRMPGCTNTLQSAQNLSRHVKSGFRETSRQLCVLSAIANLATDMGLAELEFTRREISGSTNLSANTIRTIFKSLINYGLISFTEKESVVVQPGKFPLHMNYYALTSSGVSMVEELIRRHRIRRITSS